MGKSVKNLRNKLELSKLDGQQELLSNDIDISELAFINRRLPAMRFEETIVSGEIVRTIEGASTVNLVVNDHYNFIKNSGRLAKEVDIKLDGLWFRLVQFKKVRDDVQLTFESREVAILRTYNKKRLSNWGQLTRARFAQVLINEVKEFKIPFICPELRRTKGDKTNEQKRKADNREPGFGDWKTARARATAAGKPITIKGVPPITEQLRNIELVLDQGTEMLVRRKLLVCAIMTIIQEATAYNHPFGDRDSVGLFQQRASWGSVAERMNPKKAAKKFYERAQTWDAAHPNAAYTELCQAVQVSAFPQAYAQWRVEAERLVTAYGVAGGDTNTSADTAAANLQSDWEDQAAVDEFQFARGRPKPLPGGKKGWIKEDTWECLNRLAEEVQWRCFEVSGSIYFISEPYLFKSAPRARLSQDTPGVDWIDNDYDINKKNGAVTIEVRLDRWAAPPGSIIELTDSGVMNGRWLVHEIRRSLFDTAAKVSLKKPRPKLPEPKKSDIGGLFDNKVKQPGEYEPTPGNEPTGQYPKGKALRDAILNNPQITFTRASQRSDIQFSLVKPIVLKFLLDFTEAGFPVTITSLRSDHGVNTNRGTPSAHGVGLAVDMGNYNEGNPMTEQAMIWINQYKVQLGVAQLIGPVDSLVYPLGWYDRATLEGHDDHIHVGWPIP